MSEMNGETNNGGSGLWTLIAGGDRGIRKKSLLPTQPSELGLFDVIKSFLGLVNNARDLGISPPEGATPEEMMRWKAQVSPWAEGEILNKANPAKLFQTRGDTVKI